MAKRESKKVLSGISTEVYQEALSWYAQLDAREEKVLAELNEKMTKLREKYDATLTDIKEQKEQHFEIVQTYCVENKDVLFAHSRSIDTVHGRVGFRTGTPGLKLLPKMTWVKVLAKLEEIMPAYVRVKKEVDKDKLIDDREHEAVKPHLTELGVRVVQEEIFSITLKKEEPVVAA